MKFLILDNYDSFVYNIAQSLGSFGILSDVVRNNKISLSEIGQSGYDAIIISPGPGTPENKKDFGVCSDVITKLGDKTPILGVCLGHQGIIHAFGGKVTNASSIRHGKTSSIEHTDPNLLFDKIQNPFVATRYHSLVGDRTVIPEVLNKTAVAKDDGEVMAIEHKKYPIFGVQFHPESVMTKEGIKILKNFVIQVRA